MATVNLFSALVQVSISTEEYTELSPRHSIDLIRELSEKFSASVAEFASDAVGTSVDYGVELTVTSNGKPVNG